MIQMSSPMVQTSPKPEWRRPSDIMKLHRRKKRCSVGAAVAEKRDASLRLVLGDTGNITTNSGKRRNPFGCSSDLPASKKPNTDAELCGIEGDEQPTECNTKSNSADTSEQSSQRILFDALDAAETVQESQAESVSSSAVVHKPVERISRLPSLPLECVKQSPRPTSVESARRVWDSGSGLPLDWSLKQKVRFMSRQPFSWCSSLKSMEQAAGLRHFITQQQAELSCDKEMGAKFQRSIMYWMHPNLPWIKLFPRYTSDNNRVSRAALTTTDDEVLTSLRSDWAESFTSAFYLVRSKFCPYFYLCGHQFTVIFLAAGVQGEIMRAMVTPTTRGFREALSSEGIEFTLPLAENQKPESDCSQESTEGKMRCVEEDMDSSDHSAASVWLESIGLNKAQFPSLDPSKVKIQRESYKTIDSRPQSLLQVEGSDVQALFNFLLNWRSCVANSGPQTGLPPTIISPVGFQGATLRSLKVKETTAKQQCGDGSVKSYGVLELIGPILPHNTDALCQLFTATQQGEFTASLNIHEVTTPFNAACQSNHVKRSDQSDAADTDTNTPQRCQSSCIVPQQKGTDSFVGFNLSQRPILLSGGIKELEYSDSKFHWTT